MYAALRGRKKKPRFKGAMYGHANACAGRGRSRPGERAASIALPPRFAWEGAGTGRGGLPAGVCTAASLGAARAPGAGAGGGGGEGGGGEGCLSGRPRAARSAARCGAAARAERAPPPGRARRAEVAVAAVLAIHAAAWLPEP